MYTYESYADAFATAQIQIALFHMEYNKTRTTMYCLILH